MVGANAKERARVFIAEIRSVNNRFREVILRIPRTLQDFRRGGPITGSLQNEEGPH